MKIKTLIDIFLTLMYNFRKRIMNLVIKKKKKKEL